MRYFLYVALTFFAGNESITMYSTADFLNVRKDASIDSPIITQIPFSTKLQPTVTPFKSLIDGKEYKWYFSKEVNGYISEKYLSMKKSTEQKSFALILEQSNEGTPAADSKLILKDMTAIMHSSASGYDDIYQTDYSGDYRVKNNFIEINWTKIIYTHKAKETGEWKLKERTNKPREKMRIYWDSKNNFWLSEATFNRMKTTKYKINKNEVTGETYYYIYFIEEGVDPNVEFGVESMSYTDSVWRVYTKP